jgi:glycosyltransferase involved in cell wall biosynthesis
MKIAIVHDDLMRRGGAEKVVLDISNLYPDAPIYTLAYKREFTYPEFKKKKIITSWFQAFARTEFLMKWLFFPFGLLAMRSLKLNGYDLVIMSTTYCAKYVRIAKGAMVVAYCYTPFRLAWNPDSYSVYRNTSGIKKGIFKLVVNSLRNFDKRMAKRVDYFIAMTSETRSRLIEAYSPDQKIPIINPSVSLGFYEISKEIGNYYLVVSRFEPYKKVDLVIEAFNSNGRNLIVVGKGSEEQKLRNMAKSNIEFRQNLSNEELAKLYQNARALIFPQYEDYGLTPIEANAAGRPVIAYGRGGVLDTMVPYNYSSDLATAYFFNDQTISCLNKAIEEFEKLNFVPENARKNAERFSNERFSKELGIFINKITK